MHRVRNGPGRPPGGFTLIELLVVITIIMILSGMLTAAIFKVRERVLIKTTKVDIGNLSMGLAQYKRELGAFPLDDEIPEPGWTTENGMQEALVYYLGSKHSRGINFYGPYVFFKRVRLEDRDGDGFNEYTDPFGGYYYYAENASATVATSTNTGKNPRSYDLVSGGPDQMLGGDMTAAGGYQTLNDPAEEDNITNWSD